MQRDGELTDLMGEKLETTGKDIPWLAECLSVSEETVRDWMSRKRNIPENKRKILMKWVGLEELPLRMPGSGEWRGVEELPVQLPESAE